MKEKNALPKSLHTVSVLVAFARQDIQINGTPAHYAVRNALHTLGYHTNSDVYGLALQAIHKLSK